MFAATVSSSARFTSSARAPARCLVARCMKAPEPETDSIPGSTSEGGVTDASAVRLDVPVAVVDTAVLGPVQGAFALADLLSAALTSSAASAS